MNNESQIKLRVDNWVKAINQRDMAGTLAWHHEHIVMFDVVPPFQSVGIDAYRATFVGFFEVLQSGDDSFAIADPHIIAGEDVAFFYAPMKCLYYDKKEQRVIHLDFRLTIGFKKIDGEWWFMHEHHSEPANV
jgi:ketosteroid isomerase-like protein